MNRQYRGFTPDDFTGRDEYNPEYVDKQETGVSEVIREVIDYLLVVDCKDGIEPGISRDSKDEFTIARTFSSLDTEANGDIVWPLIETKMELTYIRSGGKLRCEQYEVKITKIIHQANVDDNSLINEYSIERFGKSDKVVTSMSYPDIVYDTYNTRAMSPYDEDNLKDELLAMRDQVISQERDDMLINQIA